MADVGILGGGANLDEGIVVGLGRQRIERPLQRLAGVSVLGGARPEDDSERGVGGGMGEGGGEGGGVGGVGESEVDCDGGEAPDVGLGALRVGLERGDAEVVVGGGVARPLDEGGGIASGGLGAEGKSEERE